MESSDEEALSLFDCGLPLLSSEWYEEVLSRQLTIHTN
jgi:hypothetical protein